MQASTLLFCWGSYSWARNLLVLINYLFFLPVMLPFVLPRLTTDSAARMFPGVWKPLFLRFPSQHGAPSLPPLSLFSSFIFFPTCFWRQWSAFLGAWALCQHSEVVLWNLLSDEMCFWWICEGESGLPVLFLCHLRTTPSPLVSTIYFLSCLDYP